MIIIENKSLKEFNTFNVDSIAKKYIKITSKNNLIDFFNNNDENHIVLGGGSNIVLNDTISNPLLHIQNKGLEILQEDENSVLIDVQAGENWHNFVSYCQDRGFNGFENLALIPGNVGTAPVQNIGAYGIEQGKYFVSLEYFDTKEKEYKRLQKVDCEFGYRDSVFKHKLKNNAIIWSVRYKIPKNAEVDIEYPDLQKYFQGKSNITNKDVFNAVIQIRRNKLPYPDTLPNSGSFFKNPVIDQITLDGIKEIEPEVRYFEFGENYKIPAAWLIEKCGLKGFRESDLGIYENHALVIVNYGKATGQEIFNFSEWIIKKVKAKYDLMLQREINLVGF